jgi:uncharacterized membrane protein
MIEHLYSFLAGMGYTHPIHPPLTHVIMGMVIGTFVFGFIGWVLRNQELARTAHHCMILALVLLLPTAILGYMDWQHFYAGVWLFPIKMKLSLAILLLFLLVVAFIKSRKTGTVPRRLMTLYLFSLVNVTALGYFGGELVFGPLGTTQIPEAKQYEVSGEQFMKSCSSCHPKGGNIIKASLPLKNAPQLADFETFLAYVRNPAPRDGSSTNMPSFGADKLTEKQVQEIYRYITQTLAEN